MYLMCGRVIWSKKNLSWVRSIASHHPYIAVFVPVRLIGRHRAAARICMIVFAVAFAASEATAAQVRILYDSTTDPQGHGFDHIRMEEDGLFGDTFGALPLSSGDLGSTHGFRIWSADSTRRADASFMTEAPLSEGFRLSFSARNRNYFSVASGQRKVSFRMGTARGDPDFLPDLNTSSSNYLSPVELISDGTVTGDWHANISGGNFPRAVVDPTPGVFGIHTYDLVVNPSTSKTFTYALHGLEHTLSTQSMDLFINGVRMTPNAGGTLLNLANKSGVNVADGFQYFAFTTATTSHTETNFIFDEIVLRVGSAVNDLSICQRPLKEWLTEAGVPPGARNPLDRHGPLGLKNLKAYALGIPPFTATAADLPAVESAPGQLRFSYSVNLCALEVTVSKETSKSLTAWEPAAPVKEDILWEVDGIQGREAVFALGADRLFVRLRLDFEALSVFVYPGPAVAPPDAIPAGDRVRYVAPNGNNSNLGTEAQPYATLAHAINGAGAAAQPGDVIVVRGGVYSQTDTISIGTNRNGTEEKPVTVINYPGETPVFDFTGQSPGTIGIRLNASHWRIIGLTIRNAGHNGIRMDGSHNRLERLIAHNNHDTGIHMAGTASHNLVLNCDSFHNFNTTGRVGNNADGFGAKFDNLGPGNHFYGCRAWENSDDGFDFWRAQNTIILERSWAFGNGDASVFGHPADFEGGGNGFKLGGDHQPGHHIVIRCLAFHNFGSSGNAKGFDQNNNTGALTLVHNTAFNNGRNYAIGSNAQSGGTHTYYNNLHVLPGGFQLSSNRIQQGNSWQIGNVTASMVMSTQTAVAKSPRQPDGSLPELDLLRPNRGTFMIDGGVTVPLAGFDWPFSGNAPDMGALETVPTP